ncbi:MAG: hypothetical protein Q7S66_01745 [bacterium]|nr:hypothetical protein [bacterium]
MLAQEKIIQPFSKGKKYEAVPSVTESTIQEHGEFGVEKPAETTTEQQMPTEEKKKPGKLKFPGLPSTPVIPTFKDDTTIKIEKIMEEDLKEIFATLSPITKQEFKLKGETTAAKIRELLKSSHSKAKKIFALIVEWLKILPGINRFFLEQEAKIKTDKMIGLKP